MNSIIIINKENKKVFSNKKSCRSRKKKDICITERYGSPRSYGYLVPVPGSYYIRYPY